MDTIADFLTAIRNALAVGKRRVVVPFSNLKMEIARVLLEEGYILDYKTIENGSKRDLEVRLKYCRGEPVIHEITRASKPGRRVYAGSDVKKVAGGLGIAILTTNRGVLTDREARKQNVGGEVICYVW